MLILLDNGHGEETPGKCSPDGRLREYAYTRELAKRIERDLSARGYKVVRIVPETRDIPLAERCRRVNAHCDREGAKNVLLVSLHVDAAPPDDGEWHQARGWTVYTSRGQTQSDILADCLYAAADRRLTAYKSTFRSTEKQRPLRSDRSDGDNDKEAGFYILTHTKCAAVLTENLFQDNVDDVEFLQSYAGQSAIVDLHVQGIIDYIDRIQ